MGSSANRLDSRAKANHLNLIEN